MKLSTFNKLDATLVRIDRIYARTEHEMEQKWYERMRDVWTPEFVSDSLYILGLDLAAGGSSLDFVLTVLRANAWTDTPLASLPCGYRDDQGSTIGNSEEPLLHCAMADGENEFENSVQGLVARIPLIADNNPPGTARTVIGPIFGSQSQGNRTMVALVSYTPQLP
jgi:hypothetical protein